MTHVVGQTVQVDSLFDHVLGEPLTETLVTGEYVLDPQSAAHELTVQVLLKVDEAFYRMYRTKERENQLANGTISGA